MPEIVSITLPFNKEKVRSLKVGDIVELTGNIYTARDAAHERIAQAVYSGDKLPMDFTNSTIFYCGPCPAKPGQIIGSLGPTTSARMDTYMDIMLNLGMVACIGKGDRASYVTELIRQHGAVYLVGVGGASAVAARAVREVEEIAYSDLGAESIKRYYVDKLKVVVAIDHCGNEINY